MAGVVLGFHIAAVRGAGGFGKSAASSGQPAKGEQRVSQQGAKKP